MDDDLVWSVLLRLPFKFLFRCKAVCKLWNSTITDPRFFAEYRLLRTSDRLEYAGYFLYPTRTVFSHRRKPVRFYGNGSVPEEELIAGLQACSACFPGLERPFICSSNGVLLCYSMSHSLRAGKMLSMPGLRYYVCNPLTKDWRELPGPPTKEVGIVAFLCRERGDPSTPDVLGLYYEYEVVRVLIYKNESGLSIPSRTRLEIYSSKTDKWSTQHSPLQIGWNDDNRYLSMVIGGVFYWLDGDGHFFAYYPTRNSPDEFDVNCLEEGPMPPNVKERIRNERVQFSIGESVNGELVCYVGGNERFDVWVHRDADSDGMTPEWEKTLEMNFSDLAVKCPSAEDADRMLKNPRVTQMPGNPGKVLVGTQNFRVYSYDFRTGNLETVHNDQEACFGKMYNYFYCPYQLPSWFFRV